MPHVIVLVVAGAGLYAGYRWLTRKARHALAERELKEQSAEGSRTPKDLGQLVWDEAAGVYRPARRM